MKTYSAEPFKIKMVEPIRLISREERERKVLEAGYNLFLLNSEDVYIDLLTDSGTGAMSDTQWGGLMRGDESYAGSRSFYRLVESVREGIGYPYVIPTHQGRGAEQVVFPLLIRKKGQIVAGNMHFDTTKAHIELAGGKAVNYVIQEAYDTALEHPFKGNFDTEALERDIQKRGPESFACILITITCNSSGGQPVEMANIREVSEIGKRYEIPVWFDAARFAENAYFIKQREKEFRNSSIREIVKEMFSYGEGITRTIKQMAVPLNDKAQVKRRPGLR